MTPPEPPSPASSYPRPPWQGLLGAWFPLFYFFVVIGGPWWLVADRRLALTGSILLVYLATPALARLWLTVAGRPVGEPGFSTPAGRSWYVLNLLQMPFTRVPLLEEALRLVPGLYQLWLRLWGSRVSLLSVWGPGVLVTERWAVVIEPGVIIGAGAVLSGHLLVADGRGGFRLLLAPVRVEAGAVVGGRATLGPGSCVAAGETFLANQALPPHVTWRGGRRQKSGSGTASPTQDQAGGQGPERQARPGGDG